MSNYDTLVGILDQIRKEAPENYRSYHPLDSETEKLNQARAKALIHLYLKVKFGLLTFRDREHFFTDDSGDGGIDGYYLDHQARVIYLIQSKYRTNEANFEAREIAVSDLLKMETNRIIKGYRADDNGKEYNGKVLQMIDEIAAIRDVARWDYKVVVLANVKSVSQEQLKRLTGGLETEIVNFNECYEQLVFPLVAGTYFAAPDLYVYLNLSGRSQANRIVYTVTTEHATCEVTVLFVPTGEIGKFTNKYRNAILRYNPRSYLELSNNPVNSAIRNTVKSTATNEFALFNNGLTMLSDETRFTESTGQMNRAQVKLTNPQIINGGQTAFTLARLHEEMLQGSTPANVFDNKEVLVRIITIGDTGSPKPGAAPNPKLALIEEISRATNQQTAVTAADRRANDEIQVTIQQQVFARFGRLYERKRGEFADGLANHYVSQTSIIDREQFLRAALASSGLSRAARGEKESKLFTDESKFGILKHQERLDKYYFAYRCLEELNITAKGFEKDQHNRFGVINYGNALRYGRYAVIAASCISIVDNEQAAPDPDEAQRTVLAVLHNWRAFEGWVTKQKQNGKYFQVLMDPETEMTSSEMNWANYYKGTTLDKDIATFFNQESSANTVSESTN